MSAAQHQARRSRPGLRRRRRTRDRQGARGPVTSAPRSWPSPWTRPPREQRAQLGPAGLQATRAAGADAPSVGEHDVFLAEPTQAGAPVPDAPLNETTPAPLSAPAFDWPSTHEQPQIADQAPPPPPTPPPSERAAAVPPRGRRAATPAGRAVAPADRPRARGRDRRRSRGLPAHGAATSSDTSDAGAGRRRDQAPGGPRLAADRRPAVPASVRGGDGRRRQGLDVRRHRVQDVEHHDEVYDPETQPVVDRARPAGAAAPLLGRDLQGRGRRDRRLRPRRRADVRTSRTASTRCARARGSELAIAEPSARRGRGRGRGRQDRRRRRPGRRQARAARPRSSTASGGRTRPTSRPRASTSARRRTAATSTPSAGARCRPTRTPRRSSATTRESDSWTKLKGDAGRPRAASASRTPAAASSRSAARARRPCPARCSATTSRATSGRSCRRCRPRVHGVAVTALGSTVYAIGGATEPGHVGSTSKAEILDLSGGGCLAGEGRRQVAQGRRCSREGPVRRGDRRRRAGLAVRRDRRRREAPRAETAAYDRAINTWTTGPKLPEPVNHAAAVNYKGEAVVIGGFLPGDDGLTAGVSDRVYALRGDKWEQLPPLNHARAARCRRGGRRQDHRGRRPGRR